MESPKELNKIITKFNKPLIVFRIRTPKIYDVTIEMIKYLIDSGYVEYVYLENPDKIKNDPVFQDAKYDKYLKNFVAETQDSNICIIIGGDGTCLWANQLYKVGEYNLINRKEINCTVYKKKDFDKNKKIDINDFEGYEKIAAYNALNELILEKKKNMSHLYIFLKDKFLAKVSSDGFIASTPTGSTAYSLSAGGPILHNDVQGIIISAICPFSLSFRPIVLPTNVKLRIKNNFEKEGSESIIKIDGNDKGSLNDDMYLEASLSDETIDFILLKSIQESQDTLWIQKLSKSLGWNYAFNH